MFLAERGGFKLLPQNSLTLLGILKVLHINVQYCCVELAKCNTVNLAKVGHAYYDIDVAAAYVRQAWQCVKLTCPSSNPHLGLKPSPLFVLFTPLNRGAGSQVKA